MKRHYRARIGTYNVEVVDYQYTRRAPVAVRVIGTTLGEAKNPFGEDCYWLKFDEAMTMQEGIAKARAIVAEKVAA